MKKRLYLLSASTAVFLLLCLFAGCYAGPSGAPAATASVSAIYTLANAGTGDSGTMTFYSDDTWYKEGLISGYRENCKGTYSGNAAADGALTITRTHTDHGAGWFETGATYSISVSGGSFTDNGYTWTR